MFRNLAICVTPNSLYSRGRGSGCPQRRMEASSSFFFISYGDLSLNIFLDISFIIKNYNINYYIKLNFTLYNYYILKRLSCSATFLIFWSHWGIWLILTVLLLIYNLFELFGDLRWVIAWINYIFLKYSPKNRLFKNKNWHKVSYSYAGTALAIYK